MICGKLQECADGSFAGKEVSGCRKQKHFECIESSDRRSKVKCEERRKKYILENTGKRHYISYKMDGGIIVSDRSVPAGTCKCDYLFLTNEPEYSAILIELKGVDVAHALKQVHGTLMQFQDFFLRCRHVYGRIVVTSSVPNLKASPDYVNLSRMIRQRFGGNIKIGEKEFSERDTELTSE